MPGPTVPERQYGLIDREKVRGVFTRMKATHASDPANARVLIISNSGRVSQIEGFFQEGETGEPAHGLSFSFRQDLNRQLGGGGRAPSALAQMLLGVGL